MLSGGGGIKYLALSPPMKMSRPGKYGNNTGETLSHNTGETLYPNTRKTVSHNTREVLSDNTG